MIRGSLHSQNITVLKVTMLMVEPKIHKAKKKLELQEKQTNPRWQSEMPSSLLSDGHHSHPCSNRVCGTPPAGQDSCSAMHRRASQPSLLWSSLWNTPPRLRSLFSDGQKSVAVILALCGMAQLDTDQRQTTFWSISKSPINLEYLKYYKVCCPTITELNSKSIGHHLEHLQIFENSVTHFKISHESKKEIIREIWKYVPMSGQRAQI